MSGFENDIAYAKNADFTQVDNQAVSESNGLITNGQMWIGTTATNAGGTHVNVGALTSPDSSITFGYSSPNITAVVAGGSTVGKTITGNTGGALPPTSGNWNFLTANSTVKFAGSGSTETLDFGLSNIFLGNSGTAITSAANNSVIGITAGAAITSASNNILIGSNAGNKITQSF